MSFNDILYFVSLVGCIIILIFRGRIHNNSFKTKLLSAIAILIISAIPYINSLVLILLTMDWLAESYQFKELTKKKRPF